MRFLRVLASGLLLVLILIGLGLWYAAQHQSQLVGLMLAQVRRSSGLQIESAGSRLGLGTHLVVVLEHPRLIVDHQVAARLSSIRAVFNYGALMHRRGLPLYSLVVDHGTVLIQSPSRNLSQGPAAPNSLVKTVDAITQYAAALSSVSRRFELVDIALRDWKGRPLAEHLNGIAYREHYRRGRWPWLIQFDAEASQFPIAGARFSGNLTLGCSGAEVDTLASARVWFWNILVRHTLASGLHASAHLLGDMTAQLSRQMQIRGAFHLEAPDVLISGQLLKSPLALGRYWSRGDYRLSQSRAELTTFELRHQGATVLEADARMLSPFEGSRALAFAAHDITIELPNLARWLRAVRAPPPLLLDVAERLRSGTLMLTHLALDTPQPLLKLNLSELRQHLELNASVENVSYVPPPDLHLSPVEKFDGQIVYSRQRAQIKQGTGRVGASKLSDLSAEIDLGEAPDHIRYSVKLASVVDSGELYQAAGNLLQQMEPRLKLLWIRGKLPIELQAQDSIEQLRPAIPHRYLLTADLSDLQFKLNELPAPIGFRNGNVELRPGYISLHRVIAIPSGESGNAELNGVILGKDGTAKFNDFIVELHQLDSGQWLPLLVNPEQLSVRGPVGGRLVASSNGAHDNVPSITGKLTLTNGMIWLGILRNPIIVTQAATLALDGTGLILDVPASRFEGEPLDLTMTIDDLAHPELRLDAAVARLDFEAMRFIRLPWSPKPRPHFLPVPVFGHIAARAGNFDKLAMTQVSTDFKHDSKTWLVYNFHAKAFSGDVDLSIAGRAGNDWINMRGGIIGMDAGPLFLMSGKLQKAPIVGKLTAAGNLWANTDTDFFRTLAGDVSIRMTNGTLNRFTLLKRILSLINLKNWLTAQMPDPRQAGVPFNRLSTDFQANRGVFYTHDLRLDGPVMDIIARGNVDLHNSTMNMEIDLLAFQTVNWLVTNIPLIGKNLGGATKGLVGAYFQVGGPIEDPVVRPKPLTSVAEFVARTLTLPFNLIVPDTFK